MNLPFGFLLFFLRASVNVCGSDLCLFVAMGGWTTQGGAFCKWSEDPKEGGNRVTVINVLSPLDTFTDELSPALSV